MAKIESFWINRTLPLRVLSLSPGVLQCLVKNTDFFPNFCGQWVDTFPKKGTEYKHLYIHPFIHSFIHSILCVLSPSLPWPATQWLCVCVCVCVQVCVIFLWTSGQFGGEFLSLLHCIYISIRNYPHSSSMSLSPFFPTFFNTSSVSFRIIYFVCHFINITWFFCLSLNITIFFI